MTSKTFLSIREAAEILSVSPTSVYRMIKAGKLPAVRIGERSLRIRAGDLDQYIEARRDV